jgi:protein-tyrosine phosphatase
VDLVDLHSHILCGVDDGARSLQESIEIAAAASAAGVRRIVATPHIRTGPTGAEISSLPARVRELNEALSASGIPLDVETGGEVDLSRLATLDAAEIEIVGLAGTQCVLIETPYGRDPIGASFESLVRLALSRGITPLLAHPERNPQLATVQLVGRLVAEGAYVQITASSLFGEFGRRAHTHALELIESGLAHVIASDAHDAGARIAALAELARDRASVAGAHLALRIATMIDVNPAALLSGEGVRFPPSESSSPRRWERTLRGVFSRR